MNNKTIRFILGFLDLILILAAFYYSKIFLFILSIIFIIITMAEFRGMLKVKNVYPHMLLPEIIGIISAYISIFNVNIKEQIIMFPLIIIGTIFSFILTILSNKKPYILTTMTTVGAFILIICGLYVIKITYFFINNDSWYMIFIYFLSILAGDFAASQVGPRFKPIHIAPEISPNKTLAGSIANLVTICLFSLLYKVFLGYSLINCLIIGLVISIFSQLGDLAMSTIKRDLGIKHSSTIFYNYGGILDRMDSFIFSAPVIYYSLIVLLKLQ